MDKQYRELKVGDKVQITNPDGSNWFKGVISQAGGSIGINPTIEPQTQEPEEGPAWLANNAGMAYDQWLQRRKELGLEPQTTEDNQPATDKVKTYKYAIVNDRQTGKPPINGQTWLNFPSLTIEQMNAIEDYALKITCSKPETMEWKEGFPPLYKDCLVSDSQGRKEKVYPLAYDDQIVVYKSYSEDVYYDFSHYTNFSPIKADKLKQELISDLNAISSGFEYAEIGFIETVADWLISTNRLKGLDE